MDDAEAASYFQLVLLTMSDVKGGSGGGHGRPVSEAGCRNDLLYDSHISFFPPSLSLSLSLLLPYCHPQWVSNFLCFFIPACHITF